MLNQQIIIRNHPDYRFTVFGLFAFILLAFMILIIFMFGILRAEDLPSLLLTIPVMFFPMIFFVLLFYFWLWDTFGMTQIEINQKSLIIIQRNKLFSKPKHINLGIIQDIVMKDLTLEITRYNIRFHPFSRYNFALKLVTKTGSFYIVKWMEEKKAKEVQHHIKMNL